MRGGAHIIIFLGYAVWLAWSENIDCHVTIDNSTGHDTPTCGGESTPCQSLDHAITDRLSPSDCNDTVLSISLRNGDYTYSLNGSDEKYQFRSCDLSITGEGNDVNINCTAGAGFAFLYCSKVNITNVKFHYCGASQPGTSTTDSTGTDTIPVHTALYFAFCNDITLSSVHVTNSITSGVVMFNTKVLSVVNSHFLYNSVSNDLTETKLSNGGFYVEFCYCDPGVANDNCIPHNNTGANYTFHLSSFEENKALKIDNGYNSTFYIPYQNNYFSFGRGGGLSIVFKGNASDNVINVNSCTLYNNSAIWGGGAFVEFEDNSNNNNITFYNTSFWLNQVLNEAPTNGTGGGGARVDFLFFNDFLNDPHYNNVTFHNCSFIGNSANHGGGLSLLTTPEPRAWSPTNSLTLIDCRFYWNDASLGAATDLSTWHSIKKGVPAMVVIEDCEFFYNGLNYTDGAIYADTVPVIFNGRIIFYENSGSALSVFGTGITFTNDSQAHFINNLGWTGGAISLLGNAYISINPGVNFTFHNNSALVEGGAIYALLTSRHDILSSRDCFIQYYDETIHPSNWSVNLTFTNNTAPMGNSIFTTSLLPCAWGASYGKIDYTLEQVFNWTGVFSYTPNDHTQISSGIANLSNVSVVMPINVAPGNVTQLPVSPTDDRKHTTQGTVWLHPFNKQVSLHPSLTTDYMVTPQGHPGESSQVLIVTTGARNVSLTINITLAQCPPGYKWNNDSKKCKCGYEDWDGIMYCDDLLFPSVLARGSWAGYMLRTNHSIANGNSLVTVKCPSQYCNTLDTPYRRQLPHTANVTIMDHMICGPQNRTGKLCGRCISGNGIAINVRAFKFNCIHCSDTKYSWLVYISSEFLPLTIFFIIILFFDINLHSGATSSIILYFQVFDALRIVSENEIPPPPGSVGLIRAIQFLYNVWNLQFLGSLLPPYCLADNLNTMDILVINYASGLFPFFLFFIVYLLKNLSCNCCPESHRLSRLRHYFHKCWYHLKWHIAIEKSILSGLATVWTLTFTKLALISFLILSRTSLNAHTTVATYQGTLPFIKEGHLPYAIPAIIILIVFVYLPATSLLYYPLIPQLMGKVRRRIPLDDYIIYTKISWWLERPFIKLKPIIDCFQGSYRPHREYFAGLLFWYRLAIFMVFAFSTRSDTYFWNIIVSVAFLVILGVVQPFKNSRDNTIMSLSVLNIITISALNIYLLDHYHVSKGSDPVVLQWWQLVLVMLPFIIIVIYFIWKAMKKVQAWRKGAPPEGLYASFHISDDNTLDGNPLMNFPAQLLDESENVSDEDDNARQDNTNRSERNLSKRRDNHSLQHSSRMRESNRRDLDRRQLAVALTVAMAVLTMGQTKSNSDIILHLLSCVTVTKYINDHCIVSNVLLIVWSLLIDNILTGSSKLMVP